MIRNGNCTAIFTEYGWLEISHGKVSALTKSSGFSQGEIAVGLKVAYKIGLKHAGKWNTIAFTHIIDALAT